MHEDNKKTSEKLAQTKNLCYLCIKQKNKRPCYPGNDLKTQHYEKNQYPGETARQVHKCKFT